MTRQAHHSDDAGAQKIAREHAAMELATPSVLYADGAYVSSEKLAEAAAQGGMDGASAIGTATSAGGLHDGGLVTPTGDVPGRSPPAP